MNKETQDRLDKLGNNGQAAPRGPHPAPVPAESNTQQQIAETREVAGRHKNDGQKDHKGAR